MAQASVWYDTCPVCQGRGAIPCGTCSGIGHDRDTGHGRSDIQPRRGEDRKLTLQRTTVAVHGACRNCSGRGAVSCKACHGHGMKGQPAFTGVLY
jgi:DnaJ-class molecular chaperone